MPSSATIAMEDSIKSALGSVVGQLSDENYAHSLAFYRLWFDIGQTYPKNPSDQISDTIWNNRGTSSIVPECGKFIHPTAQLIIRLASDAESDHLLAPHSSGLQNNLIARSLREFFNNNLRAVGRQIDWIAGTLYTDANLIAHWANLGYVEEAAIRNHILQSLISHPTLYDHQADTLIILFKVAGPTFEAYADPSVVDRCFELLKDHSYSPPYPSHYQNYHDYLQPRKELVQVSPPPDVVKCGDKTKGIFRRYSGYGSEGGRVSLPRLDLRPGGRGQLA